VWIKDIQNRGRDGESAVSTALMELRRNGYAQLQRNVDRGGRTLGFRFLVSDASTFPKTSKQVIVRQPERGFQEMGQPQMGRRVCTENNTTENDAERDRHAESAFVSFWNLYPKKIGEKHCRQIFRREKLRLIVDQVITGLQAWIQHEWRWKADRYIPYPKTWLIERRWENPPQAQRRDPITGRRLPPISRPVTPVTANQLRER